MKIRSLSVIVLLLIAIAYFVDQGGFNYQRKISDRLKVKTSFEIGEFQFKKNKNVFFDEKLKLNIKYDRVSEWDNLFKFVHVIEKTVKVEGLIEIFSFKVNSQHVSIFQINQLSGNFVIKVGADYFLCESEEPFDGVYKNDVDKKIKSFVLTVSKIQNYKKILFKNYLPSQQLKVFEREIIGSEKRVRVKFDESLSFPKAPEGVSISRKFLNQLEANFLSIDILSISHKESFPYKAQALFYFKDNYKDYNYLYSHNAGKDYLYNEEDLILMEIDSKGGQSLFTPVEDLWEGRVLKSKLLDQVEYSLSRSGKDFKFQLDKRGQVHGISKLLSKDEKQYLQEILCFVSFCHEKYRFYKVSKQKAKTEKELNSMTILSLNNEKVYFQFKKQWLTFYNAERQVSFNYIFPDLKGKIIIDGLF